MSDKHPPTAAPSSPCLSIDGQDFKELCKAALGWLQRHQAAINALNVYPVPDGDTGTNMVLTMQSAWAEVEQSPERSVGRVAHMVSHGALMGARGNSGVILSQVWRGFARALDEKEICRAPDLAAACQEAAATAYKGVIKPVEGTILTVARIVADTVTKMAQETQDLGRILEHMVFAAHEAVVLTPSLLPVLEEAGVVDAGGQGLFVILEGMLRYLRGEAIGDDVELAEARDLIIFQLDPGEAGYGYDVQFLVVGNELDVDAIRQRIAEAGECPLVVGDGTTVKVHVHVTDPGIPISYGASLGSLRDVLIEDMQAQFQDFIAGQELPSSPAVALPTGIGVVTVVMGEGLAKVFQSLGVSAVVHGGQTMNPSTKDILEAVESVPAEEIILLPNNGNIILAAEQACSICSKRARVIPTRSIPQGVTALLALNLQASLEENVAVMIDALDEVESGVITTATRSATIDAVEVTEGQIIGLHNGELKVANHTVDGVTRELIRRMDPSQREIITLYHGALVTETDANALAGMLQEDWPYVEIEVIDGGQPHYHYIVSVE